MLRHARNDVLGAVFFLVALVLASLPAHAVRPDEMLADPVLEARAREISKELRCLVCRNQSIDDSEAGLAHDLRVVVRERLTAGDSDKQVVAFVVARYGDYVLLRPPFKLDTWLLWLGPPVMLAAGAGALARYLRRRAAGMPAAPLSAEEDRRLAQILRGETEP